MSIGKVESGRVPEKGPRKHRERLDPGEYQKGGIRASAEKVEIQASTGEGS